MLGTFLPRGHQEFRAEDSWKSASHRLDVPDQRRDVLVPIVTGVSRVAAAARSP
jgi:hypothetical protein